MSRKNQKGFLLAESLIVATFVLSVLIFLFVQFKNLSSSYDEAFKFNTVEGLYALDNVKTYLKENTSENQKVSKSLMTRWKDTGKPYLIIYGNGSCNDTIGLRGKVYCNQLMQKQNVKSVIFTKADITTDENISGTTYSSLKNWLKKTNLSTEDKSIFSENFKQFILRVNVKEISKTYRLIAEFENGSFATLNVGDEDWNSSKYNDPDYVEPTYNNTATAASCFTTASSTISGGIKITGYTCGGKTPKIPSEIGGKRVVEIGAGAFLNKGLTSVIMPAGIREIGANAFKDNKLTSISIPVSMIKIGDNAFYNNQIAGTVTIPDNVMLIGNGAFYKNNITTVNFGTNVSSIGDNSFNTNKITKINLNDFLYKIGSGAFANNLLTNLELPDSVYGIGTYAFQNNNISSITIPESVENIGNVAFDEKVDWNEVEIDGEDPYRFNATWTEIGWPIALITGKSVFSAINDVKIYDVPLDGYYRIDLWGAAGSASSRPKAGGKGGYISGVIKLTSGTRLYVYVGGKGGTVDSTSTSSDGGWNGGGDGSQGKDNTTSTAQARSVAGAGGGATDIRKDGTALGNRIIVAGGGGGGSYHNAGGAGGTGGGNTAGQGKKGSGVGAAGYGVPGGGGGYIGGAITDAASGASAKGGTSWFKADMGWTKTTKIDGNHSMPNPGLTGKVTGNSGAGYAMITYVGVTQP